MPEWRMTDVVDERESFDEIDIKVKRRRDGSRYLCDFDGVRKSRAEMIADAMRKNLGLVLEPTESPRMDDAVAVALEVVTIGMRRLRITASARLVSEDGVRSGHGGILALSTEPSAVEVVFGSLKKI
jgi:hypothetical protein